MNYNDAIRYLGGLNSFGVKLGLESTRRILGALGRPEEGLRIIHVAGTNGKGSVCAMASSVLKAAGRRPGMFTSPHVERPEERIRVSGRPVDGKTFAALAGKVAAEVGRIRREDPGYTLTFFEHLTAMSLLHFRETGADPCLLEVGLGGRLDATNVVRGRVAVITPLSLDHTGHLGDTVEKIALEKLAIVKEGGRVVACAEKESLVRLVEKTAAQKRARAFFWKKDFSASLEPDGSFSYRGLGFEARGLRLGLRGKHQAVNAAAALAAVEASGEALGAEAARRGLAEAHWPGRLELFPGTPPVLLDGAHNPAGAGAVADYLTENHGADRIALVTAIKSVKDHGRFFEKILPPCGVVFFTRGREGKWAEPDGLLERYGPLVDSAEALPDPTLALEKAMGLRGIDLVLVAGSIHLLGEVRPLLGRSS